MIVGPGGRYQEPKGTVRPGEEIDPIIIVGPGGRYKEPKIEPKDKLIAGEVPTQMKSSPAKYTGEFIGDERVTKGELADYLNGDAESFSDPDVQKRLKNE